MMLGQKNRSDSLTLAHRKEIEAFEELWKDKIALEEEGNSRKQQLLDQQYNDGLINFYEYQREKQSLSDEQAMIDEQMLNDKLELDKKHTNEKNMIDEQSFKSKKAFNMADALMNIARSITAIWSSYSTLGPIGMALAPIQTAAVVSIGAAQVALIRAQQFVPAYAMGTNFHPGGIALVGEEGPELVNLPRGSVVNRADITKNMISSAPTINITVNGWGLSSKELATTIAREVNHMMGRALKGGTLL